MGFNVHVDGHLTNGSLLSIYDVTGLDPLTGVINQVLTPKTVQYLNLVKRLFFILLQQNDSMDTLYSFYLIILLLLFYFIFSFLGQRMVY